MSLKMRKNLDCLRGKIVAFQNSFFVVDVCAAFFKREKNVFNVLHSKVVPHITNVFFIEIDL